MTGAELAAVLARLAGLEAQLAGLVSRVDDLFAVMTEVTADAGPAPYDDAAAAQGRRREFRLIAGGGR